MTMTAISAAAFRKKEFGCTKEKSDFFIVYRVNEHYTDLQNDFKSIASLNAFSASGPIRRAILFDFFQIGELVNRLSSDFRSRFNNRHTDDVISMRNRVVHGYQTVRDDIVYATIKEGLPLFVDELNSFAAARYRKFLEGYLGKRVRIMVDSSYDLGDFRASIGTVDGLLGLDGRYQKARLVSLMAPQIESTGTVKAIIGQEKGDFGQLVVFEDGIFLKETEEEMITRLRSFRL